MSIRLLILLSLSASMVLGQDGCSFFKEKFEAAKKIEQLRKLREKNLEDNEFNQEEEDLGYERTEIVPCRNASAPRWYDSCNADLLTTTARLMADVNPSFINSFESNMQCVRNVSNSCKSRPKYRTIDGYSNNIANPYWGATGAPFGRFGPKNYYDKIHTTRKSVSGNYLPNARQIVQNILLKAEKFERSGKIPNDMANFAVLYITHDIGSHVTAQLPTNKCEDMRCCIRENRGILSKSLRNSACLPIVIPDNDPFYKDHDIKCLNFIRSQMSTLPSKLQLGEIMNKATGYLDLSLVYGVEAADTKEVRSFSKGKLNVNSKNLMATDVYGNYTRVSDRMLATPVSSVWPALFTRNHNKLAEDLAACNSKWNDEKLFQEARRINIALLQSITYNNADFIFESKGGLKIDEKYNENMDVSSNLEFHTAAYRYFHFYVNSNVKLLDKTGAVTNIPLSDAFGKLEIVENNFDSLINGLFSQPINFGQYTEELTNKFAKNHEGLGVDVISFDVMRGRDHGLPTYLQTRRQCGLKADFNSFDDLTELFPQSYVDLLKSEYDSVEDIDLVVGGSLESYLNVNNALVGETFDFIIRDQFKRVAAGDVYFYTNPSSPHPFTAAQIQAIKDFSFNNLVCVNSGVESVPKSSFYVVNNSDNPMVSCSQFKPMNVEAWKNV